MKLATALVSRFLLFRRLQGWGGGGGNREEREGQGDEALRSGFVARG